MVSAISSWAEQIIIAIIIATILEMIIPDCKNKKYVKTVIGLYILFTILSPVIKNVIKGDISFASSDYLGSMNEISDSYNKFNNITNNNIQDTYILSLKQDITGKLYKKGYIASIIKIDIEENEENYGQINSLNINLSKKPEDEETKTKSNNNISINKVEIENKTTTNKTVKSNTTINDKEIKEVKEYLNSEYGVDINNIKIN